LYLPASSLVWTKLDDLVNHKRRYSKSEVKKLLTSNKFKVEKIIYVDFIGWVVLLLSKIFRLRLDFDGKNIKIYDSYIFKSIKFLDFFTKNIIGKIEISNDMNKYSLFLVFKNLSINIKKKTI